MQGSICRACPLHRYSKTRGSLCRLRAWNGIALYMQPDGTVLEDGTLVICTAVPLASNTVKDSAKG